MHEREKWKWSLSPVRLLATPWTAAYQAPLSLGFSRQEYWNGVPLPSPHIIIKSPYHPSLPRNVYGLAASIDGHSWNCWGLFIQQAYIEYLLHARYCMRPEGPSYRSLSLELPPRDSGYQRGKGICPKPSCPWMQELERKSRPASSRSGSPKHALSLLMEESVPASPSVPVTCGCS